MDDLISRSEAIRIASGYCHWSNIPTELAKLPSVTPKHCEDAISRQAVEDAIYDYSRSCDVNYAQIMEYIDKLPSVSTEKTKIDWDYGEIKDLTSKYNPAILNNYLDEDLRIKNSPSVSTEKTGHWIESNGVGMFVCSVCNESFYPMPTCLGKPLMKYCPNCGSQMEGVK